MFEIAGMKCTNGQTIYSNSLKSDTDDDGLLDSDEVEMYTASEWSGVPSYIQNIPYKYVFTKVSDPNMADSDGDGYGDYSEVITYKSNPNISNINKVVSLSHPEYVRTQDPSYGDDLSFGGYQSWFGGDIENYGCGVISSCDILLYMSLYNDKFKLLANPLYPLPLDDTYNPLVDVTSKKYFTFKEYEYFVRQYYKFYFGPNKDFLTNGVFASDSLELYFNNRNYNAKVTWGNMTSPVKSISQATFMGITELLNLNHIKAAAKFSSDELIYNKTYNMLKNDIPVMLSIGPNEEKKLELYLSPTLIRRSPEDPDSTTNNHYVTVTSILYNSIKNTYVFEISSWGVKYYIDFNEYNRIRDIYSDVTNIVLE